MNRDEIFSKISQLTNSVNELTSRITGNKNISRIETDLMLQHLRELYDLWLQASQPDQEIAPAKQIAQPPKTEVVEIKSEAVTSGKIKIEAEPKISEESKSHEDHFQEQSTPTISHRDKQETVNRKPETVSPKATLFDEPITHADQFKEEESLHAQIAKQQKNISVADQLHHSTIKDLKAAIGINEKFLFINQLFGGNSTTYNRMIDAINSCADYDSAFLLLQTSKDFDFDVNREKEVIHVFLELVRRRFS